MLEELNKVVIGENSSSSESPMKIKKCEQAKMGLHLLGFIQGPKKTGKEQTSVRTKKGAF